jgi:uncharacterized DUF497 family protein
VDADKDRQNQRRHRISFATAQCAFADPHRVIAVDAAHSDDEPRYFCFGRVGEGVLSVRFTFPGEVVRIIGAGYWRKGSKSMSAKIKYTDEPLGEPKVVPDFLPAPEDLVFKEEGVKVTLALSKRSVDFFKREAAKHRTQYQRMIRRLLDAYAEHHSKPGERFELREPGRGREAAGKRRS